MKNLLIITPDKNSHICFYRSILPFKNISKIDIKQYDVEVGWTDFIDRDIIYMDQPYTPQHLQLLQLAKKLDKKVWIDYTFNPFIVEEDPDNPKYTILSIGENIQAIVEMLKFSDIVTVSKKSLVDELKFFNKNTIYLPNEISDISRKKQSHRQKKIVFYRSYQFCRNEIIKNIGPLLEIVEKYPDWKFKFQTHENLFFLRNTGLKNIELIQPLGIISYLRNLEEMSPKVMLRLDSKLNDTTNYLSVEANYCFAFEANINTLEEMMNTTQEHNGNYYVDSSISRSSLIEKL